MSARRRTLPRVIALGAGVDYVVHGDCADVLPLLSGDPSVREKVKEEYFKKHPREEKRLRQLDRKAYGAFD